MHFRLFRKGFKKILLAFVGFFLIASVILSCSKKATEIKIIDTPIGVSSVEAGQVLTLLDSSPIKKDKTAVYIDKIKQKNTNSKHTNLRSQLVAARFGQDIRLLDLVIPEINKKPELSFKSSARSLVFMNPIFLGLSARSQIKLFESIDKEESFGSLVELISRSNSVFDNEVISLSSKVAIDLAFNIFQEEEGSTPSTTLSLNGGNVSEGLFENKDYPKSSCGDSLPSNPKQYPIRFYPVYVKYSKENLSLIKTKFCQDAYKSIREKTGNETIQVGSFITLERAEKFKQLMIEEVGNGEVGQPTIIENPQSIKQSHSFYTQIQNYLFPTAYAQDKLKYEISRQLSNSGKIGGWPQWHGLTVTADSTELKVIGTSPIAQQLVVLSTNKLPSKISHNDFSKGDKLLEKDILGELLLLPAELGTWDLSVLKTLSGNSQISQILKPKEGSNWLQDSYTIILSGGSFFNRRTNEQKIGAFDFNLAMFFTDLLSLTVGLGDDKLSESAVNVTSITDDCIKNVFAKSNSNAFTELSKCLAKPDNLVKVAKIFGLSEEEIAKGFLGEILKFEGVAWDSFKDKGGKRMAKAIDFIGKTVNTGRIGILGLYLDDENRKGYYSGEFEVRDYNSPQDFTVDLLEGGPHILMDDLELKVGREIASIKNYSQNWYSIESIDSDGIFEKDLLLIRPADDFSGFIQSVFDEGESSVFNLSDKMRSTYLMCQIGDDCSVQSIGLKLDIQRYSEPPTRKVTISCDSKPLRIWGLIMKPRCTSGGMFVNLKRYSTYRPPVKIRLDNGQELNFAHPAINESSSLTSNGKQMSFTISAKNVASTR